MAVLKGAFNTVTNQFLGNDPDIYRLREVDSHLMLWGLLNTDNGEFIATQNPIKYTNGGVMYGTASDPNAPPSGFVIDDSVDYRGSKFTDEAYMQRGKAGTLTVADAYEYAESLSQEAKQAMIAAGMAEDVRRTTFFKNTKVVE